MAQLSPMMAHYLETKKQYPDCILFYRLGDFYEMFFEDAKTASRELEITLTGKECGLEERAPMCGVPYHAVDNYLNRLVQKGYKVAIAEQMEDPKTAKGLVKREVIRVVTPGTITSSQALEESKNNYLMGIVYMDGVFGISSADISTGDYLVTEVRSERTLLDEIYKFSPSEIICNEAFYMSGIDLEELKNRLHAVVTALENRFFSDDSCRKLLREHFHVNHLDGLGISQYEAGTIAAGAVLQYLCETQKSTLEHLTDLIERAIVEEPPISVREGGMIKDGYSEEADRLRHAKTQGKDWLADLEAEEKEKTGIKTLKVKFNKVFGYYFEVTNSFKDQVPDYFIRRQTLTNAERFTTERLKELEGTILGAEDKLFSLEYDLFCQVRDAVGARVETIQKTAKAIALLDVLVSLSAVATRQNYVKPKINEKGVIHIKNGRHPVVEQMMRDDLFVANDTYLDNGKNRISIITGPNMAGKSTYMRQTALITLMAQIGSFVPADEANIGLCDRIFTRVGASDDLASGQSTFMVEMTEVANILRNATRNSLLILDEIGRGTSTFDGLSIAWAVVEYISSTKTLGAKTLFATHYHELTELEGAISGVNNYCIAVKEQGDNIVFLRKIVKGGADKSYGIQVAKLAGVPEPVISRAKELVEELSDADITARAKEIASGSRSAQPRRSVERPDEVDLRQMSIFDTVREEDIIRELMDLDISRLSPVEALVTLDKFQSRLKNRWEAEK